MAVPTSRVFSAGGNGPRAGRTTGRARNTLVNNASKATKPSPGKFPGLPGGYQAPVSSAGAVGYGDQLAAARYQYLTQLAALKSQRGLYNQQYRTSVADARSVVPGQLASVQQGATDRGVLGSSAQLSDEAGVLAARTRAIADAKSQRVAQRLDNRMQQLGAQGSYYGQVSSINNAIAQEQAANTIMAFQQDQFDAMQQNYQSTYQNILQSLKDQKSGRVPRQRNGTRRPGQTPPIIADPSARGYAVTPPTSNPDWYLV